MKCVLHYTPFERQPEIEGFLFWASVRPFAIAAGDALHGNIMKIQRNAKSFPPNASPAVPFFL